MEREREKEKEKEIRENRERERVMGRERDGSRLYREIEKWGRGK